MQRPGTLYLGVIEKQNLSFHNTHFYGFFVFLKQQYKSNHNKNIECFMINFKKIVEIKRFVVKVVLRRGFMINLKKCRN